MGGKKGFTLVELMVVMAIIALLAVIGISGLININRNNTIDRATEEIVTAIRESQNMAISVASDPVLATNPAPLAWGVYVSAGAKTVQLFYLDGNKERQDFGSVNDYSILDSMTITGDVYYFFTTPFGKYYTSNNFDALGWTDNSQRPHDVIPSEPVSTDPTSISLTFKGSTKNITIETNGDVHVQ